MEHLLNPSAAATVLRLLGVDVKGAVKLVVGYFGFFSIKDKIRPERLNKNRIEPPMTRIARSNRLRENVPIGLNPDHVKPPQRVKRKIPNTHRIPEVALGHYRRALGTASGAGGDGA